MHAYVDAWMHGLNDTFQLTGTSRVRTQEKFTCHIHHSQRYFLESTPEVASTMRQYIKEKR